MNERVLEYLLFHGYDIDSTKFKINSQLGDYIENVIKTDKKNKIVYFNDIKKEKVIKKSRSYLNKYFNIHDVGYLNNFLLLRKIGEQANINDIATTYNDACIEMSPFDLPINYVEDSSNHASLQISTPSKYNKELLKDLNIYFLGINLSYNITDKLIPIYIHEIVHTQLESNKGIVTDIKNREVLSIFIELLYTYQHNKNKYEYFLNQRLNELMSNFNRVCKYIFQNKEKDTCYVIILSYLVSTIKALKLLDTYLNSNKLVKKEIMKSIQNVFDADNSLEEFLDEYEIDYDNSLDSKVLSRIIK